MAAVAALPRSLVFDWMWSVKLFRKRAVRSFESGFCPGSWKVDFLSPNLNALQGRWWQKASFKDIHL